MNDLISAEYRVKIDGTSRLITALPGAPGTLPSNLIAIGLVREADAGGQVHYNRSAAVAPPDEDPTPQWPAEGVARYPIGVEAASQLQFISSGGDVWATLWIITQ